MGSVGPSLQEVIRDAKRELRTANRTVGRGVAKAGKAAIVKGAPRMFGKRLGVKTKVDAYPNGAIVEFRGKPAGGWAIVESGAKPHGIKPKRAKVLTINAGFAMFANHPGMSGHKAWTHAGERLEATTDRIVENVYDKALI